MVLDAFVFIMSSCHWERSESEFRKTNLLVYEKRMSNSFALIC